MPDLSESFVALIVEALNSAEIPCVLWGHYVHGVPSIIGSIDFVIPDSFLSTGSKVLSHLDRLVPCPDSRVCPASSLRRQTPPPTFHAHVKDSEVTVSLYLQSDTVGSTPVATVQLVPSHVPAMPNWVQTETLWFLMPLEPSLSSPKKAKLPSPFAFASDQTLLPPWRPGRGSRFFKPSQYPVIIPKSHVLLEAFMHLYARDSGKRIGAFAMPMIGYIEEYVDEDGYLEIEQVSEPLSTFYKELREGGKPVRQWTEELKEVLGLREDSGSEAETAP